MSKIKAILIAIAIVAGLVLCTYGYLAWFKDYAPRMENARHAVFKQTQSYVDGKITHLNRLKLDYQTKGEAHKSILRATILSEASTVDRTKLPPDLRRFIETLE